MRILSLNIGDATVASSQYRIHAFREPLASHGITLEPVAASSFEDWSRLSQYDAVIVQKKLFSIGRVRWIRRHAKRLIYDIDDAIWAPQERKNSWPTRVRSHLRLRMIARAADRCFVANEVIAKKLRSWTNRVTVFPMALDGEVWTPAPSRSHPATPEEAATRCDVVRIGWAGAPGNLRYLEVLEPVLLALIAKHPEVRMVVFCGKEPAFRTLRVEHVPWQPGTEPQRVRQFSIGLLPLARTDFASGKSPIKGMQYMACGIPTVATPLEATRELFHDGKGARFASTDAEWSSVLEQLVLDPNLRQRIGSEARQTFEAHYNLKTQAEVLATALKQLISTPGFQ